MWHRVPSLQGVTTRHPTSYLFTITSYLRAKRAFYSVATRHLNILPQAKYITTRRVISHTYGVYHICRKANISRDHREPFICPLADTLTVLLSAKHIVCPSGQHRCIAHHFSQSENITMPQAYFTAIIGSLGRALAPSARELSAKLTEGVSAYRRQALLARRQGELHRKAEG